VIPRLLLSLAVIFAGSIVGLNELQSVLTFLTERRAESTAAQQTVLCGHLPVSKTPPSGGVGVCGTQVSSQEH
jgi:hypothetical protein